jgi:hypothetical protein
MWNLNMIIPLFRSSNDSVSITLICAILETFGMGVGDVKLLNYSVLLTYLLIYLLTYSMEQNPS